MSDPGRSVSDAAPESGRSSWRSRPRRFTAIAVAVLLLGSAGVLVILGKPDGKPRARAAIAYCGLLACSALRADRAAAARSPSPALSPPASAGVSKIPSGPSPERTASLAPVASPSATFAPSPSPTATAKPAPTPKPTPQPKPKPTPPSLDVTVTYSIPESWDDGFQGELTMVNHTSSAVNGWQITITLPGDQVDSVWGANWRSGAGSSLIMTAASYDQVIEPGASQSVNFTAQGTTTSPATCTFDADACR